MIPRILKALASLTFFAAASLALAQENNSNGGAVQVPDNGSTALLLGAALVGAALGARRLLKK